MGSQASVPFCESSPCLLGCGDQVPKAFLPPQLWSRDPVSSVRTMCRGQLSCACPDPETGRDPSWQGGGRAGTARVRDKVGQSPAPACPPTHLLSARLRPEVDSQVYVSHLAGREGWAKGAHLAGCRGSGGQAPAGCPPACLLLSFHIWGHSFFAPSAGCMLGAQPTEVNAMPPPQKGVGRHVRTHS